MLYPAELRAPGDTPLEATAAVLDHVPVELNRHYNTVSARLLSAGSPTPAPARRCGGGCEAQPDPRLVVDIAGISEILDRLLAAEAWALAADTGAATTRAAMAVEIKRMRWRRLPLPGQHTGGHAI